MKKLNPQNIKIDEALNLHTMTKMGGDADLFVTPETEDEAAFVVQYAYKHKIPILLLEMDLIWSFEMVEYVGLSFVWKN